MTRPPVGLLSAAAGAAWLAAAWAAGTLPGRTDRTSRIRASDRDLDELSARKHTVDVDGVPIAYLDEGNGEPLVLLHGCPFSAYEWRDTIPRLAARFRVIAPDLLGLGDTEVTLSDDYRLPRDAAMICGLLDAVGIDTAHVVGHDHGGATCLLLMGSAPERLRSVVLTNIEAYDAWPSDEERIYLKLIVHPLTSPLIFALLHSRHVRRRLFAIAAHRRQVLTDEALEAFVAPHIATAARWQRLRRFFAWQLDPAHRCATMDALAGMRAFMRPTLVLWGRRDVNFGEQIAHRLIDDIPGAEQLHWMQDSGHLPMLEEPDAYADAIIQFASSAPSPAGQQAPPSAGGVAGDLASKT
jgi:pimeloyl-ACP methyl ester carboxylesterase